jgi:S1-C subfamily serine protease
MNSRRPSIQQESQAPQQLLPVVQAQSVVKTPQIPTPDSALRHKPSRDDTSYFPIQNDSAVGSPHHEIFRNPESLRRNETHETPKTTITVTPMEELESPTKPEKPALSIPSPEVEELTSASPTAPASLSDPVVNQKVISVSTADKQQPPSRSLSVISVASSVGVSSPSNKETWDRTLSRVINGIVSIKATTTRPFDTESAGDYTATGFVISKEHGLILSNRHVVNPAPITCVAVFVNYEEIPIWPVYRDPIHDFGIFRYDPEKLKHIKVEEIELHPDAAHVGEDIRVVGNDAGEKLSVSFVIRR